MEKQKTKKQLNKGKNLINDLKIELLKNPLKRKSIRKEIAKILTEENKLNKQGAKK